jgi:hypothetical protein
MPFISQNPRLEGRYSNPGPQRIERSMVARFLGTLMNRDAIALSDTTNSAGTTTAPLIPPQIFRRSANPQIPPDLASMRAGTTRAITARNVAGRRYTRLDMQAAQAAYDQGANQ